MSTLTPDEDTADEPTDLSRSGAPRGRRGVHRVAEVGVVLLALAAVAVIGISRFGPDHDGFCAQVAALPPLRTDAATPAAALVAYAEGMDRVAGAAGDRDVAEAAAVIGTYHQRLSTAIGAGPTSTELLDDVESMDTSALAGARATLDRAITQRCS